MKFTIIVCTLVVLASQSHQANAACSINGEDVPVGEKRVHDCNLYTCEAPGTYSGIACPVSTKVCPEGQRVEQTPKDTGKPYPECCPKPICV